MMQPATLSLQAQFLSSTQLLQNIGYLQLCVLVISRALHNDPQVQFSNNDASLPPPPTKLLLSLIVTLTYTGEGVKGISK